jgi:hypothetical protein
MMPNTIPATSGPPVLLEHTHSELCWCEPAVEVDEDGKEVVVHKDVTWN